MAVIALRWMTVAQVKAAVDGLAPAYPRDWEVWLGTPLEDRVEVLGQILRRWQATRPVPMRRPRREATHAPPYLDDLVADAVQPLAALGNLSLRSVPERSMAQQRALADLWAIFSGLTVRSSASCVGVSKAVMLLTDGRIGPALDSRVRASTKVAAPMTDREWFHVLDQIADDLAAFERGNGPLNDAVSPRFAHLGIGRLYDMVFGPRRRSAALRYSTTKRSSIGLPT